MNPLTGPRTADRSKDSPLTGPGVKCVHSPAGSHTASNHTVIAGEEDTGTEDKEKEGRGGDMEVSSNEEEETALSNALWSGGVNAAAGGVKTYVIGHRNPDADSVCSAIGYAAFKRRSGQLMGCVPARAGNSNPRIDAILKRFGVPLPVFVGDVTPRVEDVMRTDVKFCFPSDTCAEALEMIGSGDKDRVIPVLEGCRDLDSEGGIGSPRVLTDLHARGTPLRRLISILSVFRLLEHFVPRRPEEPPPPLTMKPVRGSISDVIRSLHGRVLHIPIFTESGPKFPDNGRVEDLFLLVGSMDLDSFDEFAAHTDGAVRKSIFVVGNRAELQVKAVMAGVRLLVLCGGLDVADVSVLDIASKNKVAVISSPYDTASIVWIIRSATRVEDLSVPCEAKRGCLCFGVDERLTAVRRRLTRDASPPYLVLDGDGMLLGAFTNGDLLKPSRVQLIFVDHNELSQAVYGAEHVPILEIIDHHRLGNPPTQQPILFRNEPVGSTCSIVAEQYRLHGMTPAPEIAGVLMGGLVSDTLNLTSPTCTARDRNILKWLSEIAGISGDELATLVFSSGSIILMSRSMEEAIRSDMKTYNEGTVRFCVSQVEEIGFANFHSRMEEIFGALQKVQLEGKFDFAALMVTDLKTHNTLLCIVGNPEVAKEIEDNVRLYVPPSSGTGRRMSLSSRPGKIYLYPGVVSRKLQMIPHLTSILRSLGMTGS